MREQAAMITSMRCSTSTTVTPLRVDPPDQRDERFCLGRIETGGRFVEQEKRRACDDRTGDLQQAPVAVGKRGGRTVGLVDETDGFQRRQAVPMHHLLLAALPAGPEDCFDHAALSVRVEADHDVLQNGQLGE